MPSLDIDRLLQDISSEAPSGANLEYDDAFRRLEEAARGRPEQQFGDKIFPAKDPDWGEVRQLALELCARTRDLRVLYQLVSASLRIDGFPGLNDALFLFSRSLEQHWETIHPLTDPGDPDDPTRVNIIAALCDGPTMLRIIRLAPLVAGAGIGRFSLRDLAIAAGEIPPPAGMETLPDPATIDAAFLSCPVPVLQETAAAVRAAIGQAAAIERTLTDHVGTTRAVSLEPLRSALQEAQRVLDARLAARGVDQAAPADPAALPVVAAAAPASIGPVTGREDVIRLLDTLCEYYARQEPSSPVPLLLQRAKRLVPMSFMEIVKDLLPDGVPTAEIYRGPSPE